MPRGSSTEGSEVRGSKVEVNKSQEKKSLFTQAESTKLLFERNPTDSLSMEKILLSAIQMLLDTAMNCVEFKDYTYSSFDSETMSYSLFKYTGGLCLWIYIRDSVSSSSFLAAFSNRGSTGLCPENVQSVKDDLHSLVNEIVKNFPSITEKPLFKNIK